MQQKLMKKVAVCGSLFFVIALGLICYLSFHKVITIAGVAEDEVTKVVAAGQEKSEEEVQSLTFRLGNADTSYLRIPLPQGVKAQEIVLENHYMDRQLWIMIKRPDASFYQDNMISGNRKKVESGTFDVTEDEIKLNLKLTGIYECRTILENDNLYIEFMSPREMHERIVVIDPACGGMDLGHKGNGVTEKEITLAVARKLKEKLDVSGIKAYYTRMDDVNPAPEERVALGNDIRADMYIRIQVNHAEDTAVYGTETLYNGYYFIPGFGSVELADLLEREVVTAIKGKALGLKEAESGDVTIMEATIPAASVGVGYVSNAQEALLLSKEEYIDKIAAGIYEGIKKAYEE